MKRTGAHNTPLMHKTAISIVKKLQDAGYIAYFAGGSVRDTIMKISDTTPDIDIVTSAKPDEIQALLPKTLEIGKKFGIIMAIVNGRRFEIATFRSDAGYSDGRRPDAIFFTSPKEDAARRDFTINSLFYDPIADKIIDFQHGQQDIRSKLIRFVGNPDVRIKEDHLRVLRAVRFKNHFDFQYHPDTYQALKKYAHLIKYISPDRIREELIKILEQSPVRSRAFYDMLDLGILKYVLPEIDDLKGVAQPVVYHREGDVFKHTMKAIDSLPADAGLAVILAVLFHDIGKAKTFSVEERIRFDGHVHESGEMAHTIMKRLNFSNKMDEKVVWLIKHHMLLGHLPTMPTSRQRKWFHDQWFSDLIYVFRADIMGSRPMDFSLLNKVLNMYRASMVALPERPKKLLDGRDVMKLLGISAGPRVGEILHAVENAQFEGKVKTKKCARKFIKEHFLTE